MACCRNGIGVDTDFHFCGTFCDAVAATATPAVVIHFGNLNKWNRNDAYDCPDMDLDCISINQG